MNRLIRIKNPGPKFVKIFDSIQTKGYRLQIPDLEYWDGANWVDASVFDNQYDPITPTIEVGCGADIIVLNIDTWDILNKTFWGYIDSTGSGYGTSNGTIVSPDGYLP